MPADKGSSHNKGSKPKYDAMYDEQDFKDLKDPNPRRDKRVKGMDYTTRKARRV